MTDTPTVRVYVTGPTGTVHTTIEGAPRTACGIPVGYRWRVGDETLSGVAATCKRCRGRS